jgi:hypothetical protein
VKPLFGALLAVGLLALGLGVGLRYETRVMTGIALGCIPTGVLGIFLCMWIARAAARRPEILDKQSDERLVFINQRASLLTVQALFGYFCLYTLLSPVHWLQGVSHTAFGSATLIFMSAIYLGAIAFYSRIY